MNRPSSWRHLVPSVAIVACLLPVLSCGDSSGPGGGNGNPDTPIPVAVGDTVTGTLRSVNDTLFYTLSPSATVEVAIFMQGVSGNTLVTLRLGSQVVVGEVGFTSPTQTSLIDRRTEHITLQAGQSYTILARPLNTSVGQFRFWIYEVDRAPEKVSATLPPGVAVTTETLENSADIDEFQVSVPAGQEVIAFLRGVNYALADPLDGLIAHVFQGAGVSGVVGYSTQDTALERNTSRRFTLATGSGRIVVRSYLNTRVPGQVIDGPYHIQLQPVEETPEQLTETALVVDDTTAGESIDYVGDIDEFTVTATPGQQLNIFFRALGGAGNAGLRLEVLGVAYTTPFPPDVQSLGTDTALTRQATGTVTVGPSGRITIRVTGVLDWGGALSGSLPDLSLPDQSAAGAGSRHDRAGRQRGRGNDRAARRYRPVYGWPPFRRSRIIWSQPGRTATPAPSR